MEMVGFGFEVDERIFISLLRGLCIMTWEEKDVLEEAYKVLQEMKNKIYATDAGTYCMVILTLSMGRKSDETLVHLLHMIRARCIPRTITFNNAIQAISGEGKADVALLVVLLMCEHSKIPSRTSYDILIKGAFGRRNGTRQGGTTCSCLTFGATLVWD
ncbi:hypothetical protein Dsin_017473 [Dipteronia sinensis]|uniref:Pentatricopeptide repeat-containing protein n=1 Tax=Dipteronia sinensis TaxID=43782 RepID=A0AAE0E6R4_9ROSI|nr:hypothetical protein Dsin_017473 [Dipteronia sinensis]